MNTEELWKCVKQDELLRRYCTGIYACDTVPKKFNNLPACYIMNTDPITQPGKHWVAIYLSPYGKHEFFDSYGRRQGTVASSKQPTLGTIWLENATELQGPLSATCGQYCLYYLSERCGGRQMSEIVSDFSCTQDRIENDELINDYINTMYNTELDAYDEKFVIKQIATALFK